MLLSWQACRKRGRKGGHAGGAGGRKGGHAGGAGIHCFFSLFWIECCFLGRHAGREGGREDMLEELESMASLSPLLKMVGVLRAADMYWNPDRLNYFCFWLYTCTGTWSSYMPPTCTITKVFQRYVRTSHWCTFWIELQGIAYRDLLSRIHCKN